MSGAGREEGMVMQMRNLMPSVQETLPDSLAALVAGMGNYFFALGYPVQQSFSSMAFGMLGEMDGTDFGQMGPFEELEPLFEPLLVQTQQDHARFHEDYQNYVRFRSVMVVSEEQAQRLRQQGSCGQQEQKSLETLDRKAERQRKQVEKLQRSAQRANGALIDERQRKRAQKKHEAARKEFKKIFGKSENFRKLDHLIEDAAAGKTHPADQLGQMRKELQAGTKRALLCENYAAVLADIKELLSVLERMQKALAMSPQEEYRQAKRTLEETERQAQQTRQRLGEIRQQLLSDVQTMRKEKSVVHREKFIGGTRAVQCEGPGEQVLEKDFGDLSRHEKQQIRDYILENARRFRTRILSNIRTLEHRRIDLPQTIKQACRTGGVPMQLQFQKPGRPKARLILFLDVSGSCREAAEMLLTFMHEMREVFPGGCLTYCFTNRLYDVSDIFVESLDSSQSVRRILDAIPRAGVYSDYCTPLREFCEREISRVTKDSLIFFMGDARNNRNPSGEEYLKRIVRKGRHAFWLNTEKRREWNRGDSIMSTYARNMAGVSEVTSLRQLLDFLQEVR